MLAVSSRLGPYQILSLLGAGGMGEVYRALDTRLDREVAVKVLPELFAADPGLLARFEREAKAVAALSHPNILAIHDYGSQGAITYAVMELLDGQTLRNRLAKGPLPWREAMEIGAAVAEGLAAAHAKGIVHRDVKPDNLFLTADGRVKILDFGLAQFRVTLTSLDQTESYASAAQTCAGAVMGTVGYMSPEQVRGQPADARSDLFSFGCVLYEMVTGRRAFRRDTAAETMTAILHDEPPDPTTLDNQVPADLARLIRHCLPKNPNQRLQSARDLALALRATASDTTPHPAPVARRPSSHLVLLAMAALLIGVIGVSMYLLKRDRNHSGGDKPAQETGAVNALAVLPFDNVGGDPKTEYLSDGIADHIINSLSQVRSRELKVRPFTSVSRYKQLKADVPTIGRELKVQVVVTGSLRQQGDELSISVALVDVRDDSQLWGNRYGGKLSEILALQDTIAREIATNLRLRLSGEEEQRLTRRYTEDPEAYLLYREGIYQWNKFTREGLETALEYFQRAQRKDPKYALAHAGQGRCYVMLGTLHLGPRETFPAAKEAIDRALALDDKLADAHVGQGAIHLFYDWDWPAAERELKQAIELDPSEPANLYGFYLAAMGQPTEALAVMQRGTELDPLAAPRRYELAAAYIWARQYDQAIAVAQKAFELNPDFFLASAHLGLAYAQKGMYEQAIAALHKGLDMASGFPALEGLLGYTYAAAGQMAEAQKVLQELHGQPTRFGCAYAIARIHAALGENDQAFEWPRKAGDERDPQAIWLKVDPTLDNLRADPRFAQMLKEMQFPP